jgi:maleylacetoacetate isomerase
MKLYTYWRSTAAYRVRIALNLKGLQAEQVPVHLVRGGGEQHRDDYRGLNPQGLVPVLVDEGEVITQSLAIVEYLDETHPEPALLPADPAGRARVRGLAQAIACEMHPLNNLRVLQYLTGELGVSEARKTAWYHHWLSEGFRALELRLSRDAATGRFCHGDSPGLADLCLAPQLYNARRFEFPLEDFPTVLRIDEACGQLDAFRAAAPEAQPDAVA